jgi:hypothetical protein
MLEQFKTIIVNNSKLFFYLFIVAVLLGAYIAHNQKIKENKEENIVKNQ